MDSQQVKLLVDQTLKSLVDQLNTVIVGKAAQTQDCVVCLLAGDHAKTIETMRGTKKIKKLIQSHSNHLM